ncbi:MHS family MFS transporter [Pseudonocardia sp. MCCB 268]|nr:MHS family MFS transporter [Pseudonocardia cytotoxica]
MFRTQRPACCAITLRVAENGGSYIFLTFASSAEARRGAPGAAPAGSHDLDDGRDRHDAVLRPPLRPRRAAGLPVYLGGATGLALLAFPFFWMIDTRMPAVVLLAFFLGNGLCHAADDRHAAAFFTELFSREVRYSDLSRPTSWPRCSRAGCLRSSPPPCSRC